MNQYEQMNIFDAMGPPLKPGDIVTSHGKLLEWADIEKMIGRLIVADQSTQSMNVLVAVRVEQIILNHENRKRLIYSAGGRRNKSVDKLHITKRRNPVRFYEV